MNSVKEGSIAKINEGATNPYKQVRICSIIRLEIGTKRNWLGDHCD
jgi:hypothetical protein